jgi:hypothetical protein
LLNPSYENVYDNTIMKDICVAARLGLCKDIQSLLRPETETLGILPGGIEENHEYISVRVYGLLTKI